jgi:ketosteroid isomerase-like protein
MIVRSIIVTLALVGLTASVRPAADTQSDEAAIRALIARRDAGERIPTMTDRVLWLASFQKPVVGDERPVLRTHERGIENRVSDTTKNTTTVRRLVIADSGDLAYEYSDGMLTFDLKDGTHVTSPNSTLRVWQKQDGQWKMAATFTITHYRD